MMRVGARRPFKWCKDQDRINANEGVPIARVRARYTEQSPLTRNMRNTTKLCQQERCADGSNLLNIGAKIHQPVSEQVLPDDRGQTVCKLRTKLSDGIRTRIPQTIGDEPHEKSAQDFPTVIEQRTPKQ